MAVGSALSKRSDLIMNVPLLWIDKSVSYKVGMTTGLAAPTLLYFAYTLFSNIQAGAKLDDTLRSHIRNDGS